MTVWRIIGAVLDGWGVAPYKYFCAGSIPGQMYYNTVRLCKKCVKVVVKFSKSLVCIKEPQKFNFEKI